ncbi:hypothetical protein SCFA_290010 [anaerobic digester metagenome]|uniref:Uncharacterized protein n=1 Tax=anaerobic digester metagenome TaxID=1263854 RepID=A0A485LZA4_9ZZZZ
MLFKQVQAGEKSSALYEMKTREVEEIEVRETDRGHTIRRGIRRARRVGGVCAVGHPQHR